MSASDKVIGTISTGEFEWRINNFSEKVLEEETGTYLSSPVFPFSSCSWCIRMYPKGEDPSYKEWISLYLHKINESEKHMSYSLSMTLQGIELEERESTGTVFKKGGDGWGWNKFILREEVLAHWLKGEKSCCQLTITARLGDPPVFYDDDEDALSIVRTKGKEILCQDYKHMLLDGMDHDIVFKVKDKEFKAHGTILQFRCPVLKSMLSCKMLEQNKGVVEIADCDPLAFEQFLIYVYSGEVSVLDGNTMLGLYFLANKYDMRNLKEECCTFIKKSLSVNVVCSVIKLALNHNDSELLEFATEFFINNAREIFVTEAWQSFIEENPVQAKELTIKVFDKDSDRCVHSSNDGAADLEKKKLKILLQNYKDLLLCGEDHDLILKVKDKEFKAHRNIMQCRCPVFSSMLTHEMLEKNSGVVEIVDCDPSAFEQFLLHIYAGELSILNESTMLDLYFIADKYDMKDLKEECCTFIKKSLSVHVVCSVIKLALNHNDSALLEFATKYFIDNAREIFDTEAWQSFIEEHPVQAKELTIKAFDNDCQCVLRTDDNAADLEKKKLKTLLQNYKDLLLCGENHDLILKVKDNEFKAHRNIMLCRCPLFSSMLNHEILEKNSVVDIPDCDPIAFEQFLLYLYTGDFETLDKSFMQGLYYIANKYSMADLKEKCCEFIQKSLSVHNIADVIRLAVNHCDSSRLEYVTQYFVRNVKEILVTVEWQSFIKENPVQANELFIKTVNNGPSYLPA